MSEPQLVEDRAGSLRCGDIIGEGQIVFSVRYPNGWDFCGSPIGPVVVEVAMQQPDGSNPNSHSVTFDADDQLRIVRGMPTPWQTAHNYPYLTRRDGCGCGCAIFGLPHPTGQGVSQPPVSR